MITRKIWFDYYSQEYKSALQEMFSRLGWQMSENPDGDGGYPVLLPASDETLFDMLEPAWS